MPSLGSAITSNGSGAWIPVFRKEALPVVARVWGTWDGATLKFQYSPDYGTETRDLPDASFTANGERAVYLPSTVFRYVVTNAGALTNLNAAVD